MQEKHQKLNKLIYTMEHYAMGMQPQGDTTLYNNPVTFYTYAGLIVVDK